MCSSFLSIVSIVRFFEFWYLPAVSWIANVIHVGHHYLNYSLYHLPFDFMAILFQQFVQTVALSSIDFSISYRTLIKCRVNYAQHLLNTKHLSSSSSSWWSQPKYSSALQVQCIQLVWNVLLPIIYIWLLSIRGKVNPLDFHKVIIQICKNRLDKHIEIKYRFMYGISSIWRVIYCFRKYLEVFLFIFHKFSLFMFFMPTTSWVEEYRKKTRPRS
jgi:hypothetical protein